MMNVFYLLHLIFQYNNQTEFVNKTQTAGVYSLHLQLDPGLYSWLKLDLSQYLKDLYF